MNFQEFQDLYKIIVKAYAETEELMWGPNYVRVSESDFQKFVDQHEVLVAFYNGKVAGGLRYYPINESTYGFGLFGADFSLSRKGIGRALVARVEEIAKQRGADKIRIEVLRPKQGEIPIKTILHGWYQQLGYVFKKTISYELLYPEKSDGLYIPCEFDCYEKKFD